MSLRSLFRSRPQADPLDIPEPEPARELPGSAGEHLLQERDGTRDRAGSFYQRQVSHVLTPRMIDFIARMEMAFIATSDARGECDCSFRAGPPGFLRTLGDRVVAYPEFRGNGVMASMGNMLENPHVGIFLVDFTRDLIGLHVNGEARVLDHDEMTFLDPDARVPDNAGQRAVHWIVIQVEEAYVHCSKRIPFLIPQPRVGGGDPRRYRGTDYFGTSGTRSDPLAAG